MNLPELFPTGEWNEAKQYFNVKDGQYWVCVAQVVGEEVVLTPLGLELTGKPEPVPEPAAPVQSPKKRDMLTRKQVIAAPTSVDDLDL